MAKVIETENVLFKRSRIHGTGGYAKHALKKGTVIIEYVGRKVSKEKTLEMCEKGNAYIYCMDGEHDLDGSVSWNPARFINHSCAPNCEADEKDRRVWITALRNIKPGEELTYDYCYDMEDYRDYPCACGAPKCCGYMVAEEFRASISKPPKSSRSPRKRVASAKA